MYVNLSVNGNSVGRRPGRLRSKSIYSQFRSAKHRCYRKNSDIAEMRASDASLTFSAILYIGFDWFFCYAIGLDNRLTDVVHRHARSLTYPEDSEMGLFFALAIPLDDPLSTKSISVAFFFESNYELPTNITDFYSEIEGARRKRSFIDRRTAYTILESKFESIGVNGTECLLRSICETTRNPIHQNNGVLGDLMRIIFTPSSSADEGLAVEYSMAEATGRGAECGEVYPLCPFGIYDYITTVYE